MYLLSNGICTMAPNEDGVICTELMAEKFGLPHWMANLSASDSNRAVLAIARMVTGRNIIAIPNFTYHGNVDETQKMMPEQGVVTRFHELNVYQSADVGENTRIFTFNDLESLKAVLADGQIRMNKRMMQKADESWIEVALSRRI